MGDNESSDVRAILKSLVTQNKQTVMQQAFMHRSTYVSFAFEHFYHDHNIHAAMRSIEIFGFQDVHIIDNEKRMVQDANVTKGADYWLTVNHYAHQVENNTRVCFDTLRSQGYALVGATPHQRAYNPTTIPLDKKIAVIFGNERLGLSDYALNAVDTFITIPMYGFTQSLNAAASVTIIAYELRKRLEESSLCWRMSEEQKMDLELEWLKRLVRGSEYLGEK